MASWAVLERLAEPGRLAFGSRGRRCGVSRALGAIRAIREAGLRVPEDVSVIGFDDIASAAYQNPGLTTVRQPLYEMGQCAADTLVARIEQPAIRVPRTISLEPSLIVRGTTARARV